MEKLSKLLQYSTLEDQFYWRAPGFYGADVDFEIVWRGRDTLKPWRYRTCAVDRMWHTSTIAQAENDMAEYGIDVSYLEQRVTETILQQVSFAATIVADARQHFGDDAIDDAIAANEAFLRELESATKRILRGNTLKIVK